MPVASSNNPFANIRSFVRRRPAAEFCELCSAELEPEHQHLVEPATRRLACSCEACALLFYGQAGARYRLVPKRVELLTGFHINDAQWDALHLPINLAFFFFSSPAQRVIAIFPSPAGPTESLLPPEAWQDLVAQNPVLAELEGDVEALLVNRLGEAGNYARVPIDQCYKLVGLVRTHWRGLSGGTEVWREIAGFYAELKERAPRPPTSATA